MTTWTAETNVLTHTSTTGISRPSPQPAHTERRLLASIFAGAIFASAGLAVFAAPAHAQLLMGQMTSFPNSFGFDAATCTTITSMQYGIEFDVSPENLTNDGSVYDFLAMAVIDDGQNLLATKGGGKLKANQLQNTFNSVIEIATNPRAFAGVPITTTASFQVVIIDTKVITDDLNLDQLKTLVDTGSALIVDIAGDVTAKFNADRNICINAIPIAVTGGQAFNVNETATSGPAVLHTVGVTGVPDDFMITGTGNTNNAFAINAAGEITLNNSAALDFEEITGDKAFTIQITPKKAGVPGTPANVTVTVNNIAPAIAAQTLMVNEGAPDMTPLTPNLTTTGDTPTAFTIIGGNGTGAGAFDIDNNGVISVNDATQVVFGSDFTLTIQASDGVNMPTAAITIQVKQEAIIDPTVADAGPFTVPETSELGHMVGTAPVTVTSNPVTGITMTGNTDGMFAIDFNGIITVAKPELLDADSAPVTYNLAITIQPGADTANVDVTITDIPLTVPNNQVFDVKDTDPNGTYVGTITTSGDTPGGFILVDDPSGGGFTIDNTTGDISVLDPTGVAATAPMVTLQVEVTDQSGGTQLVDVKINIGSAGVMVQILGNPAITKTQIQINHDNIENGIFADGFESGGVSRWTSKSAGLTDAVSSALVALGQFHGGLDAGQASTLLAAMQSLQLGGYNPAGRGIEPGGFNRRGSLPVRIWGWGSYNNFESDYVVGSLDRGFEGDAVGFNLGADTRIREKTIVGISGGYQQTDVEISGIFGQIEETLYTVSPYAAYQITPDVTIWGTGGVGFGDVDTIRNGGVSGQSDSFLIHGSATLRGIHRLAYTPLSLTSSAGFAFGRKKIDSFIESDGTVVPDTVSNMRQTKLRAVITYDFVLPTSYALGRTVITPFGDVEWDYDFVDPINDDRGSFDVGGGLRLSTENGLGGHIQYSQELDRNAFSRYALEGSLFYELGIVSGRNLRPFANLNINTSVSPTGDETLSNGFSTGLDYSAPENGLSARFEFRTNSTDDNGFSFGSADDRYAGVNLRKSF